MVRSPSSIPDENAKLLVTRGQAADEIWKQIEAGEDLVNRPISDEGEFKSARHEQGAWRDYTIELLKRRFSNRSISEPFHNTTPRASAYGYGDVPVPLSAAISKFRDDTSNAVRALRRVPGKLDQIEEDSATARKYGSQVFLVHGQNQGLREQVARVLERLGLEIVILHEQSNQGRTLIEKFEGNAANVGFAVIIASADDHGGPISSTDLRPRARQNVVFEAGFFFGALGRDRTAILYEEGVELPTDITGIVYIPISGGWPLDLAKEIRAAGFTVDLNNL